MKRSILFVITFLVFIAAISGSVKPAILFFAEKQIRSVFSGSAVSIKGCQLNLFNRLSLRDIEIKDPGRYDLKLGEVSAEYSLWSILKRSILKVSLKDAVADINLTQQDILDLSRALGSQSPGGMLSIQTLQLSNFTFHVRAAETRLEARLSAELNLKKSALDSLDLKISSFFWQDFTLEEAAVRLGPPQPGDLFIQKIQYGKVKVTDVKAKVTVQEKGLLVDSLSAQMLNGTISGDLSLKIDQTPEYLAKVAFTNLDLSEVVQAFDLKKEVQMSGRMSGKMTVTGRGADIRILGGDFSAVDPGGLLEIKNKEFLKNIARNSQQPLDIVVASFKDYHYNDGALRFALEKSDLVFDAAFDGEAGKRNINITLHDFLLRKE